MNAKRQRRWCPYLVCSIQVYNLYDAVLWRFLSGIAFEAFKNAGMLLVPPVMPPSLTTTLINTKNRARHKNLPAAERTKKHKRVPFNLKALYASESFKAFHTGSLTDNPSNLQESFSVSIGTADITCLCLRRVAMPFETRELVHDGKIDFADWYVYQTVRLHSYEGSLRFIGLTGMHLMSLLVKWG